MGGNRAARQHRALSGLLPNATLRRASRVGSRAGGFGSSPVDWRVMQMFVMRQHLELPAEWDGNLWFYRNLGRTHAMHHHAELEFNLVTQGAGVYLLANRKYQIRRGDLL